jgi:hypothetical protein
MFALFSAVVDQRHSLKLSDSGLHINQTPQTRSIADQSNRQKESWNTNANLSRSRSVVLDDHPAARGEPDEQDEEGDCRGAAEVPKTSPRNQVPGRRSDPQIREVQRVESCDVLDVAVSTFGLGVDFVLAKDVWELPAASFADDGHNASCAVSAVVAVDK